MALEIPVLMKTISQIIRDLPSGDGRVPFWEHMLADISIGRLAGALIKLANHSQDCDFQEQVEAVCLSILIRSEKVPGVFLPTIDFKSGSGRLAKVEREPGKVPMFGCVDIVITEDEEHFHSSHPSDSDGLVWFTADEII